MKILKPKHSSLFSETKKSVAKKRLFGLLIVALVILLVTPVFVAADGDCLCGAIVDDAGNPVPHEKGKDAPCVEGWKLYRRFAYMIERGIKGATVVNATSFFRLNISTTPDGDPVTVFGALWLATKTMLENFTAPIGYLLVVLYFILEIIEHTSRDNLNTELFIKATIKLFLGVAFIINCVPLLEGAIGFADSLVVRLTDSDNFGGMNAVNVSLHSQYRTASIWECAGTICGGIFNWLLSLIPALIVLIVCLSRYLDIAVRTTFAPIGMANIFEGGLNSSGMKYFKKFAASCLHGAAMLVVVSVSALLSNANALSGYYGVLGLGKEILLQLATCVMVVKSKSLMNDVMGVS